MNPKVLTKSGVSFLIEEFNLQIPEPAVRSKIVAGARKTEIKDGVVFQFYPKSYLVKGYYEQIKFALRYEPIDLGFYKTLFKKIEKDWLTEKIRQEPTGIYARKLWYLYELLTGEVLELEDVPPTKYVDLLESKHQLTGNIKKVLRQKLNDNLYGTNRFCPFIRRTEKVRKFLETDLKAKTSNVIEQTDPHILARAVQFLYTKETKSSYAIEGERLPQKRGERFVEALRHANDFDLSEKEDFVELQNILVDPRYAESDWRQIQNFIGQTMSDFREQIHFVCPKPEDVPELIKEWMDFAAKAAKNKKADPVVFAAVASFGFVFIHPFEDGNGRIHRFLIHQILDKSGFMPEGILLPVSAVMLRHRRRYDEVLESFSKKVMPFIEYKTDEKGFVQVTNETADLYRFWDATRFVEYLFEAISETIETDLKEEIGFLQIFDEALESVNNIVEMPDRQASLLVRLIMQNKGKLSKGKRDKFEKLTQEEIKQIESAVSVIIKEIQ